VDLIEVLLFVVAVGLGVALLGAGLRRAGPARGLLVGAFVCASVAAFVVRQTSIQRAFEGPPRQTPRGEYVGSGACRSCHPSEHASFRESYHRSMTQRAIPAAVLAPWEDVDLEFDNERARLYRRGAEFWATLSSAPSGAPVHQRVVLTTGSHHYQAYWVEGKRPGELDLLPFVYLLGERTFVPRREVFLMPPDMALDTAHWNTNCVQCHAVGGRPGRRDDQAAFDTRVVELGIACESCHGPGGEHAALQKNPVTRYLSRARASADATIVNPARLDPAASADVCGQCHAYFVPHEEASWWRSGYADEFRPGDSLRASRHVLDYARDRDRPDLVEASLDSIFWPDGSARVGGREYNALVESPCFKLGQGERRLTCISCHSMHDSDPDDQLARDASGNGACAKCHADVAARAAEHSHHREGSAGSECYNCHMPYTSYALLKGIRSHRIDSPDIAKSIAIGMPNACNLCHQDKTVGWAAEALTRWYGEPRPELGPEDEERAAIVTWLLAGDAAERAIAAAAIGFAPAQQASGADFQIPLLASLLDDPYAAVRRVAFRSLKALPGTGLYDADYPVAEDERRRMIEALIREAEARGLRRDRRLLVDPRGLFDREAASALASRRDGRPVMIAE
jgi:predicted CXXCH cytochrome family protein